MELKEKIAYANTLISYLKKNRYIQLDTISRKTEVGSAVMAYLQDESIKELMNWMLDDKALVNDTNKIIAYEPIIGKSNAYTLAEAFKELSLPQGNIEKNNLKYYQLFAQIAGIVLPLLLFVQESNSGNLTKEVTTITAWLNTIKNDVLSKYNTTKSRELLVFINELANKKDNQNKQKDLKILNKVLQKWFIDTKYVTCTDQQNIVPTQYFKFEIERLLESYDSEYSEHMNEMLAELLSIEDERTLKNDEEEKDV